ncbi:hypothetical protein CDAR_466391 [Caerostris darwini]|uniref:Uncharacterized protein n=1 Tax=Caerostris darwini TaxID=1538125 RepID=A0AAV4WQU9_9ARAC|nr:hypothetical protein CDAR_466391 [Caerostris darwini]
MEDPCSSIHKLPDLMTAIVPSDGYDIQSKIIPIQRACGRSCYTDFIEMLLNNGLSTYENRPSLSSLVNQAVSCSYVKYTPNFSQQQFTIPDLSYV